MPTLPNDPITRVAFVDLRTGVLTQPGYYYLLRLARGGSSGEDAEILGSFPSGTASADTALDAAVVMQDDGFNARVARCEAKLQNILVLLESISPSPPDKRIEELEVMGAFV